MARPPTAGERERMRGGPRYDPDKPKAPWPERDGGREPAGIRAPTAEEVAKMQAGPRYGGWPKTTPPSTLTTPTGWAIPGKPPSAWELFLESLMTSWPGQAEEAELEEWRKRVAEMQAQAQGQAPALAPAPVIEELGWEAWRGRLEPWGERGKLPAVELTLTGGINRWGQEYAAQTAIVLPEGFETPTDDPELQWQRYDYIKTVAYGETLFNPETGQELNWNEAARLARTNPEMPIVDVFAIGGGNTVEVEMTLNDLFTGRTREEVESLLSEEVAGIRTKAGEQIEAGLEKRKDEILGTDMSYVEKLQAVLELYGETSGRSDVYRALREDVIASLSPEEKEDLMQEKPEVWPVPKRKEPAAKVDVDALRGMLAPYGINLTGNYPFISPITEAHLMRLPPDVINEMQRYLSEQGLSWRDFLEISSSWYGGGGQARGGRFAIPRQW